jgi:hypothetical protein
MPLWSITQCNEGCLIRPAAAIEHMYKDASGTMAADANSLVGNPDEP